MRARRDVAVGRARAPATADRGRGQNGPMRVLIAPDKFAGTLTAVEAAPWLLGSQEPNEAVAAEELYETLKPFKDLVAEDIENADR